MGTLVDRPSAPQPRRLEWERRPSSVRLPVGSRRILDLPPSAHRQQTLRRTEPVDDLSGSLVARVRRRPHDTPPDDGCEGVVRRLDRRVSHDAGNLPPSDDD